ncbi:MAG: HD-GYP domain-containing protein [Lachnospiraceae bacterium]|nr:HD-GYP domain-containing protein [Lachnospiraceae bacterium]
MKVDQSIIDKTRRVLIARGTVLDTYLIEALKRLGINGVYIREGEDAAPVLPKEDVKVSEKARKVIEKLTVEDRTRVTLSESVKKRVQEGISYLYSNTEAEDFADASKSIASELLKAIDDNDALAVDISMLKVSDEYTFKHSVDVATMAMIVAKKMGYSEEEVYDIGVAGLLHDLGKAKVPPEILNKPGKLTEEEFEIMKKHSIHSYNILKENKGIKDSVKLAVLQHHEKINGQGYPMGLVSSQICKFAKILTVVDIYDALVTERPYKAAFTQRDAVEMLMAMTYELDMDALKGFLGSVILYPVNCIVQLSNGETARVVENYTEYILRPKVVGLQSGKVYDLAYDLGCANIIIP